MKPTVSYLFWATLLLSACSNEELLQEYVAPVPIRFSSQCLEVFSKVQGAIYGDKLPENAEISLFSIQHPTDYPAMQWSPELFNGVTGKANANGDILYDNTYYFPVGQQLDFFAIHPSLQESETYYSGDKEVMISLKENASEQSDLMYSALLNQSKRTPVLVFQFEHLLTQITFSITKGAGAQITLPLTKIEMVAPQDATLDLWTGHLAPMSAITTFTLHTNSAIHEGVTPIDGQFLLLPVKATEIMLTFGTGTDHVFHITPSAEPAEWEAGRNYLYNITINRDITDTPVLPETPPEEKPSTPEEGLPTVPDVTPDDSDNAPSEPSEPTIPPVGPEEPGILPGDSIHQPTEPAEPIIPPVIPDETIPADTTQLSKPEIPETPVDSTATEENVETKACVKKQIVIHLYL